MNFGFPPAATWPGQTMPGQPIPPATSFFNTTHGSPLFGGQDAVPRYTGPFNVNMGQNPLGMAFQMAMPGLMSSFMEGTGRTPFQLLPMQNLQDQITARQYSQEQQRAMQVAAQRDQLQLSATLSGAQRAWYGRDLTQVESARNADIGRQISTWTPMLTQLLGPDWVDQLHGSRGSSTIMSQQLHAALRTAADPITGRIGYSGASAGLISQEIRERYFGANFDPTRLSGLSMGQAGLLAGELQSRGMLGSIGNIGPSSMASMRGRGFNFYDEAYIARAADRDSEIERLRTAGTPITAAHLEAARGRVRATRDQALGTPGMTSTELLNLPGGEDMMRAGDAEVIGQRLQGMSRVVKAMRDIFGDMGNPNAPMHEIINGLQNLTQGGLATMSAADLESMVRRTHVIARQTGVGMQGMIALTSQAAAVGDQLGVNRALAPLATQGAALFGAGARDLGRFSRPSWTGESMDQLALSDQNLRMLAMASPAANSLNAMLRLSQEGLIPTAEGAPTTESQAIVAAINNGQTTYEWGGRSNSLQLSRERVREIVNRDHGVSNASLGAILADRSGNQEFGNRTATIVRELQTRDATSGLSSAYARPLTAQFAGAGLDALRNAGVVTDAAGANRFAADVARGVAQDYFAEAGRVVDDPVADRAARELSMRTRIREQVVSRMPTATPAQIDAATTRVIEGLGPQGLSGMGLALTAAGNTFASGTDARNMPGLHRRYSREGAAAQQRQHWQAEGTRLMQTAFAPLGASSLTQRAVDAFTNYRPGQNIRELLSDVLGGINIAELAARDPSGAVAGLDTLGTRNMQLDYSNPAHREEFNRNNEIIRALIEGGPAAQRALERHAGSISETLMGQLMDASSRGGVGAQLAANGTPLPQADESLIPTTAQTAEDVVTRLTNLYGNQDTRLALRDPATHQRLVQEVQRGNRAGTLDAGLRAYDNLANLAVEQGLYTPEELRGGLTTELRGEAGRRLRAAAELGQITDPTMQANITRWSAATQPLSDINTATDSATDALGRLRNFSGYSPPGTTPPAGEQRPVEVSGSVTITEDNRIVFNTGSEMRPADHIAAVT